MFEGVCSESVAGLQAADPFALAAALADMTAHDLGRCTAEQTEAVLAATQRVINAMAARQRAAVHRKTELVAWDRDLERQERSALGIPVRPGAPSLEQETAAALAPILRIAPRTMLSRVLGACGMERLARTAALAWAGDLEPHRADIIERAARQVADAQALEFEARLHHTDIRDLPGSRLKTRASAIAAKLAASNPEPGPAAGPSQRHVQISPDDDAGMTRWQALLPTASSRVIWAAIEELAGQYRAADPQLTVAQSRADAFTDLILSDVQVTTTATIVVPAMPTSARPEPTAEEPTSETTPPAAEQPATAATPPATADPSRPATQCRCGGRPALDVFEAADAAPTWLADSWSHSNSSDAQPREQDLREPPVEWRLSVLLQDIADAQASPHLAHDRYGHVWFVPGAVCVPAIGSLLPEQVTRILADPDTIIRLGRAHPDTGAVEHLDERLYRPGAARARLVRARDGTCRFPGCNTPAERCQLDHVIRYPHGPTSEANLQSLCGVHHGFKHHARWTVIMTPDGVCTWTAPTGRTHTTHPHAVHDAAA